MYNATLDARKIETSFDGLWDLEIIAVRIETGSRGIISEYQRVHHSKAWAMFVVSLQAIVVWYFVEMFMFARRLQKIPKFTNIGITPVKESQHGTPKVEKPSHFWASAAGCSHNLVIKNVDKFTMFMDFMGYIPTFCWRENVCVFLSLHITPILVGSKAVIGCFKS